MILEASRQVQNLQDGPAGQRPREEPVLQFKFKGICWQNFLLTQELGQEEVSLCSTKGHQPI